MSRVHVFGDEAGDLVFKPPGNGVSRYFMIGTVTLEDCSVGEKFLGLRRELAWDGILLDQLHATSDRQHVRDRAFALIAGTDLRFDATILDKRKSKDDLRQDPLYFYKLAWYLHFKYVAKQIADSNDELLVVASPLQIKRKRKTTKAAVHEAITEVVNQVSPTVTLSLRVFPGGLRPLSAGRRLPDLGDPAKVRERRYSFLWRDKAPRQVRVRAVQAGWQALLLKLRGP